MNELASILKSVAPTLATAVLGPACGAVVAALSSKLGVSADPVSLASALANPENLEKARQLELEWFKVEVEDRKSAREMQTATRSYFVPTLGFFIVASFIGVVVASLLGLAVADSVLAGTLIGYLSGKAEQVISFYFGSSHGSQNKDELLFNSTPRK